MTKVCKKHKKQPALIYGECIGCEIEMLRVENEKMAALIRSSNFWETCRSCGAQFIPGGKDVTDTCAACYKEMIDAQNKGLEELIEHLEGEASEASESADRAVDRSAQNYWIGVDGANTDAAARLSNIINEVG